MSIVQLAQERLVSQVLRGSVRVTTPTLRVTAQLRELATNPELWADRFDRHLTDELSLQGELSQYAALIDSTGIRTGFCICSTRRCFNQFLRSREGLGGG